MSTALAVVEDQEFWTERQLAVLHQTGIDQDVSNAELAAFLHEAQVRKLDPFIRQIYLLGRWDKRKNRKVYRTQTGIDGFRLIARRAADNAGVDYGYEGTVWFDPAGARHEVWLAQEPPAAAKVVVVRNGQKFDAVAKYSEYVQVDKDRRPMGMWLSMPAGQLAKCAEALALRKAFPEDLGGLYTEEEMAQADNPQVVRATAEVVRDEPAAPASQATGDAKQPAAPDQDRENPLDDLTVEATSFASADDGRKVYRKVTAMSKDREITRDDAKRLHDLIVARIGDMQKETAAEPVEGSVIAPLDPEDDWSVKVKSIADEDEAEAARADVRKGMQSGNISGEYGQRILSAIDIRAGQFAREGRAAA